MFFVSKIQEAQRTDSSSCGSFECVGGKIFTREFGLNELDAFNERIDLRQMFIEKKFQILLVNSKFPICK